MRIIHAILFTLAFASLSAACGSNDEKEAEPPPETFDVLPPAPFDPKSDYVPTVDASDLSPEVTNPWLPMPMGATWSTEAVTDEGLESTVITVMTETRPTFGTEALVVRDTVSLDGVVIEDTNDWFAQDGDGNVWYLGEETTEYVDGMPGSTAGSWEAGVDGALPGVVMLAHPDVDHAYRQEFYDGEAEDYAIVRELGVDVSVPAGDFTGCVKIEERSVLEPDVQEFKYYCEGVGNVLVEEEDTDEELTDSSLL
jgi:hypothetical protein